MQSELEKIALTELANKLFMYCDAFEWNKLMNEVFKEAVWFDMTSAGGEAKKLSAQDICDLWKQGLSSLDAVHHQAGHYLIKVRENDADIYAYAVATHYKKAATKGNTRTFIGSYDLKAVKTENGWRLNQFKYNLKCMDGNVLLE